VAVTIRIKSLGEDGFNRETYKNVTNGRIYAIVNGWYYSTSREGEPDSPLKSDVTVLLDSPSSKTIGDLLANYLTTKDVRLTALDRSQLNPFLQSAKFHGITAYPHLKGTTHYVCDKPILVACGCTWCIEQKQKA
jgi:hypothetical protein